MADTSLPELPRRKPLSRPTKVAALIAIVLAVVVLPGTLAWSVLHVADVSSQVRANQISNTKGLCALREDIQERVVAGETFLRVHPKGIPGIAAANIKTSLDGQKRTVAALRFVRCPPPPKTRRKR